MKDNTMKFYELPENKMPRLIAEKRKLEDQLEEAKEELERVDEQYQVTNTKINLLERQIEKVEQMKQIHKMIKSVSAIGIVLLLATMISVFSVNIIGGGLIGGILVTNYLVLVKALEKREEAKLDYSIKQSNPNMALPQKRNRRKTIAAKQEALFQIHTDLKKQKDTSLRYQQIWTDKIERINREKGQIEILIDECSIIINLRNLLLAEEPHFSKEVMETFHKQYEKTDEYQHVGDLLIHQKRLSLQ